MPATHHVMIQGPAAAAFVRQQALASATPEHWPHDDSQLVAVTHDAAPALQFAAHQAGLDCNPIPEDLRHRRLGLLVSDMDSTLITIECIDEIADFLHIKDKVAAITEAAMRGDIDFASSLRQRVALLAGLDTSALERVYGERLQLSPGAEALYLGLRKRGHISGLVSGGFSFFTDRLRRRLGINAALANQLALKGPRLLGKITGTLIDGEAKPRFLRQLAEQHQMSLAQTVAIGDGANDLAMLQQAGLGIAWRAKPALQAAAEVRLNHAGLDALLAWFDLSHSG